MLQIRNLRKSFGDLQVLKSIDLDVNKGDVVAILGPSGSGKTTMLRCLNFLETPDTGVIRVDGKTLWDAADPATHRESEVRKKRLHFGLVFQNFNLFPQYTALQNITLAGELLAKEKPEYKVNRKAIHAELEEKAKAGGQISLAEYAEALKTDKERGKPAKQEKPSIRAQLKAAKEQTPKKQARQKTQDLERS